MIMKTKRKLLVGILAAAGFVAASTAGYAQSTPEAGPGYGPCAFGGGGPWGGGPRGPEMMGYYGGPRGGHGPGMMMGWGGGPRGGFGPGFAGANPAERADARLAFLKNELKITEGQQAAWNAYATQVKTQASTMEAFRTQQPAAADSAAERIAQHAQRMKLRGTQAEAMSAAVKDLYATLTPEQKAIADQHFGGFRVSQGGRGYGRGRW
jgi:hypothetical protein